MKVNFNINLSKTQKKIYELIHNDSVNEVVAVTSRQIGKTTIAEIVMIEALITRPNGNVFYISPTFAQGKKVYKEITNLLSNTGLIKTKNSSDLSLELNNNSWLKFFSAESPVAIRGNSCKSLLVIDEAAYIPDETSDGQSLYHSVIKPICKVHHPKVLFISTPCGKSGVFYEKYLEGLESDKVKTVVATIYDDELISEEEIEELKQTTPPNAWQQEFLAKFIDSSLTAFPSFENQFIDNEKVTKIDKTKALWIGLDLSSVGEDETILTFVDVNNNTEQHLIEGTLDQKYRKIAELIDSVSHLNIAYCEANGVGEPMIEGIKRYLRKNKSKIVYWTTTNENKNEMVGKLSLLIDRNEILFNINEKKLFQQFGWFIYKINKVTRTISYAGKPGKKDDRIMSLLIALRAKEEYPNNSVKSNYRFVASVNKTIR